jgi:hypothetical protein
MNTLTKILTLAVASAAFAASAVADTKFIEGQGVAEGPRGLRAEFGVSVRKVDANKPEGRFNIAWTLNNAQINISLAQPPANLGVREKTGRFSGPAIKRVRTAQGTKEIRGWAYVTCVDLRDPQNPGDRKDHITVRFVRDLWGNPDGDDFFAGAVIRGDVAVGVRG